MPIDAGAPGEGEHELIRRVRVVRGSMTFRLVCRPAFDYARASHDVEMHGGNGVIFRAANLRLALATGVPLQRDGHGGVTAEFTLGENDAADCLLQMMPAGSDESFALDTSQADA